MLSVEFLAARHGDCALLHWDGRYTMLVDGGPPGTWQRVLKPRLKRLGRPLEVACVTHVDEDHIEGVLGLFVENARARINDGAVEPLPVKQLWFNAPNRRGVPLPANIDETLGTSYKQGNQLVSEAKKLGLQPISLKQGMRPPLPGLKVMVVTPDQAALQRLAAEWQREEPYDDPTVKGAAARPDTSNTNRSSISFIAQASGRSVLMTGDARGDEILAGLGQCGLLRSGLLEVDVLQVPHHGSSKSSDPTFFEKIQARHYVISTEGIKYRHPSPEVLEWLVGSRTRAARYTIHLTYKGPYAFDELTSLQHGRKFQVCVRRPDSPGMVIL